MKHNLRIQFIGTLKLNDSVLDLTLLIDSVLMPGSDSHSALDSKTDV